jgi:dipeptidyl aminopeptidase/acylaminoacyl peptidase
VANRAADGSLSDVTHVAGGSGESVFQPEWHPDGRLIFVSDPKGWWNLCALDNHEVVVLAERHAEFGLPQWVFGMRTYDVLPGGDIVCAYVQDGTWQLACLSGGQLKDIKTPYTDISSVRAFGGQVAFIGASAREGSSIVRCDPATGNTEVVARASTASPPGSELSVPEAISFETANGATAYGLFYAPQNAAFEGPADERPPLILRGHGGPTGSTSAALSLAIQYWTNRGFAVLDVNYRGSTGFGRAYREALDGQWGVADVEDMVAGANYLVAEGKADPARLAIRGGSAGGYTALAALTFADVFSAGASLYGIGDLMTLARDTHKFESRYLDRLIGPLPEDEAVYLARSPINHVEGLNCPVLFLQGEDDKVVPPNQAEAMVAALDGKGIPVAYVLFSGEGHGFRKAENVTRALEAELAFYGRMFGFVPADDLPGLEIRNL